MPDVLAFEGVTFSYQRLPVLEEASFSLPAGEAVAVIGPNGGGKTTLLKLALGLLKPDQGRVLLLGEPPSRTRQRVGYVPQHSRFDPQFPLTVEDAVLQGALGRGWGPFRRLDRRDAREAMERMGVYEHAHAPFGSLSGGQRQRALVARALVTRPEILFLDEPTAHVDPAAEARFREIVAELRKDLTLVTVSHDLGLVSEWVRKVVCVNRKVHLHNTHELDARTFRDLYHMDLRLVMHGHCHAPGHEEGCS